MERDIRQVSCDGCAAPIGTPCVNYPSGQRIHTAHNVRYFKALDAGLLCLAAPRRPLVTFIEDD